MSEMACKLLCRLSLDVRLVKEADVRANIEDSLKKIFEAASKDGWENMVSLRLSRVNSLSQAS